MQMSVVFYIIPVILLPVVLSLPPLSLSPLATHLHPPFYSFSLPFLPQSCHGQNITHPQKYNNTTQQGVPEPTRGIHTLRSQESVSHHKDIQARFCLS